MDRVPCAVEVAERRNDVGEVSEAIENEAIQSIIDDYLLLGWSYPRKGGVKCVTAGMFLQERLEDDEIEAALTQAVYGCGEGHDETMFRLEAICRAELPDWLRAKHYDLIEREMEEIERAKRWDE